MTYYNRANDWPKNVAVLTQSIYTKAPETQMEPKQAILILQNAWATVFSG